MARVRPEDEEVTFDRDDYVGLLQREVAAGSLGLGIVPFAGLDIAMAIPDAAVDRILKDRGHAGFVGWGAFETQHRLDFRESRKAEAAGTGPRITFKGDFAVKTGLDIDALIDAYLVRPEPVSPLKSQIVALAERVAQRADDPMRPGIHAIG